MIDEKIGRLLAALGDPGDPGSLRSRTVLVRCSDHGEMGLSHGGLRQKAFNAYEETINVPIVVSNPVLFPEPARDGRARLADRPAADDRVARPAPTRRGAGLRGPRPLAGARPPRRARSARRSPLRRSTSARSPSTRRRPTRSRTRSTSPTTTTRRGPRPERRPASRTGCGRCARRRHKYATYVDPAGERADRARDVRPRARPRRGRNLVGLRDGAARRRRPIEPLATS